MKVLMLTLAVVLASSLYAAPPPVRASMGPVLGPVVTQGLSGTVDENGIRVINVTARRYAFVPSQIVVNLGDVVRLQVTSLDVEHRFDLPAYGIDLRLPPRQVQRIEFTANGVGVHPFRSSVNSGPGHAGMTGEVVVLMPMPLAP